MLRHYILGFSVGNLQVGDLEFAEASLAAHISQLHLLLVFYQYSIEEVGVVSVRHFLGLEFVEEAAELVGEVILEGVEGEGMGAEVVRLHEVAEEVHLRASEGLLLECRADHVLAVVEKVDQFFVAGILMLSIFTAILKGNIRQRNQFPNLECLVCLSDYLLKVSPIFGVDFPLESLVDALNEEDHLFVDDVDDAIGGFVEAFEEVATEMAKVIN
jgi:hypothetical protein